MADWLSHILVVLIILKFVRSEQRNLLAVAAVLPDIDHIPVLFVTPYSPGMTFLLGGRFLHTVFGILALSLIFSYFRPKALKPVFAVGIIHILIDTMIGYEGIPLLFPFYTGNLGMGVLSNYTPWIPVVLSIIYVAIVLAGKFTSRQPGLLKYRSGRH